MFRFLYFLLIISSGTVAQTQDPTRPLSGIPAAGGHKIVHESQGVQLSSILYSENRRVAVINGQALSENQKGEGMNFIVKKIAKDYVVISQNKKLITLKLNVHDVKKFESVGSGSIMRESTKK